MYYNSSIDDLTLSSNISYLSREPTSYGPTLDISLSLSNINLAISNRLILYIVELLFVIQETYNSHDDNAIGDSEIEEAKLDIDTINFDNGMLQGDIDDDPSTGEVEYEIVAVKPKETTVDPDKLEKWKSHIMQAIT